MSVVVLGANHRGMPLEEFERFALSVDDRAKFVDGLLRRDHLSEVVVLATCNRTEIYGLAERFHGAYGDLRQAMAELSGVDADALGDMTYMRWGDEAVEHLFSVSAGLDSAVVGENEILGQVRGAWAEARDVGSCGPALDLLFRRAVETGKRARSETTISSHTASVSAAAVDLLRSERTDISELRCLVVGSGRMATGVARNLGRHVAELHILSRNPANAAALAERVGATSSGFLGLDDALATADVVIGCTSAPGLLVDAAEVRRAMEGRDRPMALIDIAIPRDIDPAVRHIPGARLMDMDDIRRLTDAGLDRRRAEIAAVDTIVQEEVARYRSATSARQIGPLIARLRESGEATRVAELERHSARLAQLSEADRELVESVTKSLLAKLMHAPTVALRDAGGSLRGDRLADAAGELFDLQ